MTLPLTEQFIQLNNAGALVSLNAAGGATVNMVQVTAVDVVLVAGETAVPVTIGAINGGAVNILSNANSLFQVVAGNLTLQTLGGDIIISSVSDINSDCINFVCAATGAITLDAITDSNFTVAGNNLTLSTTTAGDILINAFDAITMNSTAFSSWTVNGAGLTLQTNIGGDIEIDSIVDVNILSGGDVDIDASAVMQVDSVGDSFWQVTSGDLYLHTTVAGELTVDDARHKAVVGSNAIQPFPLSDTVNTDLNYDDGVGGQILSWFHAWNRLFVFSDSRSLDDAYNHGSSITVDTTDVDWTLSAGLDFRISDAADVDKFVVTAGIGAASVKIDTSGGIDIDTAVGLTIDSLATISIDVVGNSNFTVDTGNLTLQTAAAGDIVINPIDDVDLDCVNLECDATGLISLEAAGAASDFTVNNFSLTLRTLAAGDIIINSIEDITADCVNLECDATGLISLDSVFASNFTVTGGNLTLSTVTTGDVILETTTDGDIKFWDFRSKVALKWINTGVGFTDVGAADLSAAFNDDTASITSALNQAMAVAGGLPAPAIGGLIIGAGGPAWAVLAAPVVNSVFVYDATNVAAEWKPETGWHLENALTWQGANGGAWDDVLSIVPDAVAQNHQVLIYDGTEMVPGLAGLADTNTGLTWIGGDVLIILNNGDDHHHFGESYYRCNDGTAALPSRSYLDDTDSGDYRIAADNIGTALNGLVAVDHSTTSFDLKQGVFAHSGNNGQTTTLTYTVYNGGVAPNDFDRIVLIFSGGILTSKTITAGVAYALAT